MLNDNYFTKDVPVPYVDYIDGVEVFAVEVQGKTYYIKGQGFAELRNRGYEVKDTGRFVYVMWNGRVTPVATTEVIPK